MFHKKLLQHDTNWVVAHSKESQIFFLAKSGCNQNLNNFCHKTEKFVHIYDLQSTSIIPEKKSRSYEKKL